MRILKVTFLSLAGMSLLAASALASTNDLSAGARKTTTTQVKQDAVAPNVNPAFRNADNVSGKFSNPDQVGALFNTPNRGLQFENPVLSTGASYRYSDDGEPGGFEAHEGGGDIGFDADIYDGLIAGLTFQSTYRYGDNEFRMNEHMFANGFSVYLAKRFLELVNVAVSYNYANVDHDISAGSVNLDRDSHGTTVVLGISDRKDKWSWATSTAFTFAGDEYNAQRDLTTGRFTWGGGVGYDLTEWCTLTGAFNYHYFIWQELFSGAVSRDDDYWTVGPHFSFYPLDGVTLSLTFDAEEGYAGVTAYNTRLGASIAF